MPYGDMQMKRGPLRRCTFPKIDIFFTLFVFRRGRRKKPKNDAFHEF